MHTIFFLVESGSDVYKRVELEPGGTVSKGATLSSSFISKPMSGKFLGKMRLQDHCLPFRPHQFHFTISVWTSNLSGRAQLKCEMHNKVGR